MADEDAIAVCSECRSDQAESYILKNPFYQQGGAIPCQWCSGIVMIVDRVDREAALNQIDRERGIPKKGD